MQRVQSDRRKLFLFHRRRLADESPVLCYAVRAFSLQQKLDVIEAPESGQPKLAPIDVCHLLEPRLSLTVQFVLINYFISLTINPDFVIALTKYKTINSERKIVRVWFRKYVLHINNMEYAVEQRLHVYEVNMTYQTIHTSC